MAGVCRAENETMPPRTMPTHFLCIPLAGPQLSRSLSAFRADVTSETSFSLPAEAVRPLGTLHLTLGVMALKPETVGQAVQVLKALRLKDMLVESRKRTPESGDAAPLAGSAGESVKDDGLSITMQGLQAMQAASKTSVLYAPPTDTDGVLYNFCQSLRKPFLDAGLMQDESRPLLLHATVINTIYVKKGGAGGGGSGRRDSRRGKERMMLDARDVLSRYEDYVWVQDMPVSGVTLCRMGSKKVEVDGGEHQRYEVEAEVAF